MIPPSSCAVNSIRQEAKKIPRREVGAADAVFEEAVEGRPIYLMTPQATLAPPRGAGWSE
jgi:hypothetical protein